MKPGESIAVDNGKVMVVAWKDTRVVKALSIKHNGTLSSITRRKKKGHGETETILKPQCIIEYNQYMSGVDRLDQMISYYPFTRKTYKWPKKIFFYLLEVSLNSFVLHKARNSCSKHTLCSFQLKIIDALCQVPITADSSEEDDDQPPAKVPQFDPIEQLKGGFATHELAMYPPSEKRKNLQRHCRVCSKNGVRKNTKTYCKRCNMLLCLVKCFNIYHTRQSF